MPLWIAFAIVALPTVTSWRRVRRRPSVGSCPAYGYDLAGNTTGVCPECGSSLTSTPAR